jgi:hypothetical protein
MSKPTINAWIMLGVAALVIGGFALVHYFLPKSRHSETLCIEGDERGQTIVLVDKTDKWNPDQADRLESHIKTILNQEMKQEERLWVYAFGATFKPGFKHNFTACKPPDGRECKGFFCNRKQLEDQYNKQFLPPLLAEVQTLKIPTKGDCSPIAEVMVEIMSRVEIKKQPGRTRIVFISDMAQNSSIYTAFRGPPTCAGTGGRGDPDKDTGLLDYFQRYKGEMRLSDTSVVILQIAPDGRSPDVRARSITKWGEVFQTLKLEADWQRL